MSGIKYGYVRVSSKEQHVRRQLDALHRYGIKPKNIYADKQSGKDFNRPKYQELLEKIKEGDCIVITSLDRLGRNYVEIQEQWRLITKMYKTDIIVLDMPLLNTKRIEKNLMGMFIADIVLQILSYVSETERNNIKARQAQGIAAAKARGIKFGRSKMDMPKNFKAVFNLWKRGSITGIEAARRLDVSRAWFYRTIKNWA
jgi:DNA invertase Pin-like site-specific DNA recombinase